MNYQEFIRSLVYVAFDKKCNTLDGVCKGIGDLLDAERNIYRGTDPSWVKTLHTDCADLPLTLRAYFAWKNFLPHAVANGVAPVGYCGVVSDTRFCQNGNKVVWEVSIDIYTDAYRDGASDNQAQSLAAGKVMGFMVAYCDNDGSEIRENFIGSELAAGEHKDRGWIDAGLFGTLELVE